MNVRHMHQEEIAALFSRDKDARRSLEKALSTGKRRPEWFFAAESKGSCLGTIAYEAADEDGFLSIGHLETGERSSDLDVIEALLSHSLRWLENGHIRGVEHRISAPPTRPGVAEAKPMRVLFEKLGFVCERERLEFDRPAGSASIKAPNRLVYRSFDEVGQPSYLAAMTRIVQDSLDAGWKRGCEELGPERVAAQYLG